METIRILIADDHPLFRDGLRALLESVQDTQVVGEAATGDEAIAQATALRPDVILMDIKMPGINGIEATRRIIQSKADLQVLMLTMFDDDASVFAAMRAGARGYLLKGARQDETLRAIRAVANGEVIFGPGIAQRMMQYFASARPMATQSQTFPELSEREREILALMAQHLSNTEIAEKLVLSTAFSKFVCKFNLPAVGLVGIVAFTFRSKGMRDVSWTLPSVPPDLYNRTT
jgi:DNA-binding NarL/FixJ family response regulator